jgi:hypothetical protein
VHSPPAMHIIYCMARTGECVSANARVCPHMGFVFCSCSRCLHCVLDDCCRYDEPVNSQPLRFCPGVLYGRKLAVMLRDALPHPLLLPFRTGLAGLHFPFCTTLDIGSSRQTYLTLCRNIVISSPLARSQAVMRDRHVCCAVCSHVMVSHASCHWRSA